MLIRIGDEKRELIDAHLGVLKTKILEVFTSQDAVAQQETYQVFGSVLANMPHKTLLYSTVIALLAMEKPEVAEVILKSIVQTQLDQALAIQQDGFKSRNLFRFLGYLTEMRVVSAAALLSLLTNLCDSPLIQKDLAVHCALVAISSSEVTATLEKDAAAEFQAFKTKLENFFKQREQHEALML